MEYFPEILSSTRLFSPPLYPVGVLVVGVGLVTLALGDILDRGALAIDTIARAVREHQAGHAGLVPGDAADAEVKLGSHRGWGAW